MGDKRVGWQFEDSIELGQRSESEFGPLFLSPLRGTNPFAFEQALHALDTGDVYDAYELYLSAASYDPAHEIAVLELAPNAIIRRDLDLLKEIFERFEGKEDKIDGWSIRGKVCRGVLDRMAKLTILVGTGPDGLCPYRATASCAPRGDIRGPVISYWCRAEARAG